MGVKEYCNTRLLLSRERRAINQKDTALNRFIKPNKMSNLLIT